jgi:hypothetical protein
LPAKEPEAVEAAANDLLGWVMVAIGAWRIAGRAAPLIIDRSAGRSGQPGAHRRPRLTDPDEWRESWWAGLLIINGIVFLSGRHGSVRWVLLGAQIAIMIVTFPFWNPGDRAKRRRGRAAGDQTPA